MSLIKRYLYPFEYALLDALHLSEDELDGLVADKWDVSQNLLTDKI